MTAFFLGIGRLVDQKKPRVFIASSVESLQIAEAINANLDHATHPTLWKDGTFHLGSHSLDDLVKKSSQVDFAIFVFSADDVATIRKTDFLIVRDNVLFELGLFIGAIGKDRCYIVRPRGLELHLPSDLLGITVADYATDRGDGDWFSALNAACTKIKAEVARLGMFRGRDQAGSLKNTPTANPTIYTLSSFDIQVLGAIASTHVAAPEGVNFHFIDGGFRNTPSSITALSFTKLLKLGYIEKSIDENEHDNRQYVYTLTEEGSETFLANESHFTISLSYPAPAPRRQTIIDEDPPF